MMVPISQLRSLPRIGGIYKVFNGEGKVIYVGQAKNIYDRWNNGHNKLGEIIAECGLDAYIEWVEVPEWLLNRTESAAISFYQPKLNLKTPPIV